MAKLSIAQIFGDATRDVPSRSSDHPAEELPLENVDEFSYQIRRRRLMPFPELGRKGCGKFIWSQRVYYEFFGQKPQAGYSLVVGLPHARCADEKSAPGWEEMCGLYAFEPGTLWLVPDVCGLSSLALEKLIEQFIADFVLMELVDPNRVYLVSLGAGCESMLDLASRMPHRFAAVAALRARLKAFNVRGFYALPFAIQYDCEQSSREVLEAVRAEISRCKEVDEKGYVSVLASTAEVGEAQLLLDWALQHVRRPFPRQLLWRLTGRESPRNRFYWLALPPATHTPGAVVRVFHQQRNVFCVQSKELDEVVLRLNSALVDPRRPVKVLFNGVVRFEEKVWLEEGEVERTAEECGDPYFFSGCQITVSKAAS